MLSQCRLPRTLNYSKAEAKAQANSFRPYRNQLLFRSTAIHRRRAFPAIYPAVPAFFLGLSLATQVLSYAGSGYLLKKVIVPANRSFSVLDGMRVTVGANSIGTLGGGVLGTAMSFLWLRRRGFDIATAGLGSWAPILLNDIALGLVSLAGSLVLLRMNKFPSVLATSLAIVLLTLLDVWGAFIWGLTLVNTNLRLFKLFRFRGR